MTKCKKKEKKARKSFNIPLDDHFAFIFFYFKDARFPI